MEENNKNNEPLNKDFKEPKLRFPGFTNYWNKAKLRTLAKYYKGGHLSKDDICDSGTIPCILYGELYTHYLNKIENILFKTKDKENLIISNKDDIIMPLSGETPLDISNSAVIPFDGVALGGDLVAFRTNLNSLFLSYQLSGKRKKKIAKLAQGKSIVHSNPEYLMKLYIFYPTKEEQNKIVNTLNLLAKKINILRDKIATLKKYKKGLVYLGIKMIENSDNIINLFDYLESFDVKNYSDNLYQYTVGKNGLKLISDVKYDLSSHKVFEDKCLLVGLGIEEITLSNNVVGCISPVYNVYKIYNDELYNFLDIFLKPLLWRRKAFVTKKSTRRNFEIDVKELKKIKIPFLNSTFINILITSINLINKAILVFEKKYQQLELVKKDLLNKMFI